VNATEEGCERRRVRGAGEKPLTGRLGWLACDRRAGPACAAIDA
jgi:hypothetical protein